VKYTAYFVFIVFAVVLIMFLKNALQPKPEPVSITGSEKCGECHKLKINGDQQAVWENSKHSQAYKTLLSPKARDFASKNNMREPVNDKQCLKCHTTENHLAGFPKLDSYQIEEGVGCESCHGAGSMYSPSKIMADEYLFKHNGGEKGSEETCLKCHSSKGNKEQKITGDVCPFQTNDFSYKTEFEKIKHPVNKNNFQ
jgi:hypothetical protein